MTLDIPGYTLLSQIPSSSNTNLYLVTCNTHKKTCFAQAPISKTPHFNEIIRYQHEFNLLKNLEHKSIIKPISLVESGNSVVIIKEYVPFETIYDFRLNKEIPLKDFLKIAIGLCEVLAVLHENQVIHKDITPQSVMIDPQTLDVKIIDFKYASYLSKEALEIKGNELVEGNLLYISPEQTGRMNRRIDYRTDLYSLGCTLYFLLSGKAPFDLADPLEVIYSHMAKEPAAFTELGLNIPEQVSKIVFKLLFKNPEVRYQTALGLKYDLEECLKAINSGLIIKKFKLQSKDNSGVFEVPQKLYGREREVDLLIDSFENVSKGEKELLLVGGYSGIGKSSLVHEIHKPIVRQKGFFVAGKYDQFNRSTPYSAFIQAFSDLINILLTSDESKIEFWKNQIQTAVGENGQVLVELIPNLEILLGKQETVLPLAPVEAQFRFQRVFKNFFNVIATSQHPLVLFLDDLQWADLASLALLESLMLSDLKYLLIITAYRDNEVDGAHPFMVMAKGLKEKEVKVKSLILRSLVLKDVAKLTAATLSSDIKQITPLAEILYSKTDGNPFFLNQLLYSLYSEGLIFFSAEDNRWLWKLENIENVEDCENIIDLMTKRLHEMPANSQNVISKASYIGNKFDLNTLSIICEKSIDQITKDLWPLLQKGYLIPVGEGYKIFTEYRKLNQVDFKEVKKFLQRNSSLVEYRFLHDRVQQAAYLLNPLSEKKLSHLKIARILYKQTPAERLTERLFTIVGHFNTGLELITDNEELNLVANLNFVAGKIAKASTAYRIARQHHSMALELFGPELWTKHGEIAVKLYCELIECEYLIGNFERSKELANEGILKAQTKLDKGQIYSTIVPLYLTLGDTEKSISESIKALEVFGLSIPHSEVEASKMAAGLLSEINEYFHHHSVNELYDLPEVKEEDLRILMTILTNFWVAAYFASQPGKTMTTVYLMVLNSIKFGHTEASSVGYAIYATTTRVVENKYDHSYQLGKLAISLSEKFSNPLNRLRVNNMFGHAVNPYFNHIRTSLKNFYTSYRLSTEVGDIVWGIWATQFIVFIKFMSSDELNNVYEESDRFLPYVKQTNDSNIYNIFSFIQQCFKCYLGQTNGPDILDSEHFIEKNWLADYQKTGFHAGMIWYSNFRTQLHIIFGDYRNALKTSMIAEPLLDYDIGLITTTNHFFYQSVSIFKNLKDEAVDKDELIRLLLRNIDKLALWSKTCPDNFLHRYQFVLAEQYRLEGNKWSALELYKLAILNAQKQSFTHDVALFQEFLQDFYFECEETDLAVITLKDCYRSYEKWRAKGKLNQLEEKYPLYFGSKKKKDSLQAVKNEDLNLDLISALKAAQIISSEIHLSKLKTKLMTIMMEAAGAQRGVLLLEFDKRMHIEVIATPDGIEEKRLKISESEILSQTVLNLTRNTQKFILINNAAKDERVYHDPYIIQNRCKTILCLSIINQGRLLGLIYFENNLVTNAFSEERIKILELLAAQAAISINTSILYSKLEQMVDERTDELKNTQAQLINSSKLSALGEMAGGVAHEVNNPLTVILLTAERLLRKIKNNEESKEDLSRSLETLVKTSHRISKIVNGLRFFARDNSKESFEDSLLLNIVEDTLSLCYEKFRYHGIQVDVNFPQDLINSKIHCRPVEISQVLLNLLNNSFDAINIFDEKWIKIDCWSNDYNIYLSITDSGKGILKEIQERMMQPFFTTKEIGKGTGLGLSISKGIVEGHKGELYLDPASPNTKFVISLPRLK